MFIHVKKKVIDFTKIYDYYLAETGLLTKQISPLINNYETVMTLKYWWPLIILMAFLAYVPVLDNFFVWDDFLWLYRAKTLSENPAQMFQIGIERLYFDPIVYLSFWLDINLFGLDFRWYHLADILLHTANALLLFYFVRSYSKDELIAFISSLVFVTIFSSSDAVLWSSSRVDLFSTFFSLISLILFLRYIDTARGTFYLASICAYILAGL